MMTTFSRHADLQWEGDVVAGSGLVSGGRGAFVIPVRFPSIAGDPPGMTTPEELLAASHAACYGIGLRSLISRKGGRARRIEVEAVITADKGAEGIRIQSSHLACIVEGLEQIDDAELEAIAREVAEGCTISAALRESVRITHDVKALPSR